jgi:uncharacterized protein (DUF2267 family)
LIFTSKKTIAYFRLIEYRDQLSGEFPQMSQSNGADLSSYYLRVEENGRLLTPAIAQQWSTAVLRALGLNLDGKTKKQLAKTLPDELAFDLKRKFWLIRFRDMNKPRAAFLKEVARMGGNTDAQFALHPTRAVFHELKGYAGEDVSNEVAESLPKEVGLLWQEA